MAESKTARASAVRVVKEVHVETTEEAIKAIRDNRAAGLFVGDMSRVDKLLQAYDTAVADIKARETSAAAHTEKSEDWLCSQPGCGLFHSEHVSNRNVQMKDMDCEHGDQT